jgi:hypothetical protein
VLKLPSNFEEEKSMRKLPQKCSFLKLRFFFSGEEHSQPEDPVPNIFETLDPNPYLCIMNTDLQPWYKTILLNGHI